MLKLITNDSTEQVQTKLWFGDVIIYKNRQYLVVNVHDDDESFVKLVDIETSAEFGQFLQLDPEDYELVKW
jgi:methenyltetrahydromethanopterin cyclohydrolase